MQVSAYCPRCGCEKVVEGSYTDLTGGLEPMRCDSCQLDMYEEILKEFESRHYGGGKGLDYSFEKERQRQFEESLSEEYEDSVGWRKE